MNTSITLENIKIEPSWKEALKAEFVSPYFSELKAKLLQAKATHKVYPPSNLIFNAFNLTPFNAVKCVILGQDPYINEGEAMGLSFSVPKGVKIPPSLKNIFKELSSDVNIETSGFCGDLSPWARQGVLLLNATLSVNAGVSNSHSTFGWQVFTDAVISTLSQQKEHLVFMLWGNFAKSKASLIDSSKHLVLCAAHPSPLARGAFFGSRPFSKCNVYLQNHAISPINWDLKGEL